MPKNEIYKVPVNKTVFMSVLKECKSSIRKLGACEEIDCTERTIRRALNEEKITPCYLEQIAKELDVDSRLLSGELHKKVDAYSDEFLREMYLAQLKVKKFPYYRKRKTDLDNQPIDDLVEQILSLFEISFAQFEKMDFESKYQLQHDLFNVLVPVMRKHFEMDAYGRKSMPNLEKIIIDLENYRDDYYLHLFAEEILRKRFLEEPPFGKTKAEIRRMDTEEIIMLDMRIKDNY